MSRIFAKMTKQEEVEFQNRVRSVAQDSRCLQMKRYLQHGRITTYDHCMDVARMSFLINRRLNMQEDERRLVRAAFLHDYFLYDWHVHGDHLHGYHHPGIAARNAQRDFHLDPVELQAIESHMWPLTLFHAPASRIAWTITVADKLCSSRETLFRRG
jgi:uncharacterized protein